MCSRGVIVAKAGLIPIVAGSLFALAVASLSADLARAQDTRTQDTRTQDTRTQDTRTQDTRTQAQDTRAQDARAAETRAPDNCLAAPNGKAPAGNHWHYRTDPATQTKCWFLRPAAETAQKPATQDKPETAAAPAAAAPAASDQAGPEAQSPRAAQAARPASAAKPSARRQAADRSSPWPDPPSQSRAGNVTWPAPPPPAAVAAPEPAATPQPVAAPPQAAAPLANDAQQAAPPAQSSDNTGAIGAPADRAVIEPVATGDSDNDDMPVGLLLALAAAMLIAGLFLRRIVKSLFARRPKVAAMRREPVLSTNSAGERSITLPLAHQTELAPGWVDHLDDDVQDALRKLLRTLEREAA
jgi:hypothetical protein